MSGKDVDKLKQENGGHRIQRVPPTENKGRIHTSTVIVSVTNNNKKTDVNINKKDLKYEWFSGTGSGGQSRNKSQNCLRLRHIPTGITVSNQSKSRKSNEKICLEEIKKRISEQTSSNFNTKNAKQKQDNFGSGMRGDKTYTLRFKDNKAVSHLTSQSMSCSQYMKGHMYKIWR